MGDQRREDAAAGILEPGGPDIVAREAVDRLELEATEGRVRDVHRSPVRSVVVRGQGREPGASLRNQSQGPHVISGQRVDGMGG